MLLYLLNSISRSVYSYLRSILAFNRRKLYRGKIVFFPFFFSKKKPAMCFVSDKRGYNRKFLLSLFCFFAILFSGIPSGRANLGAYCQWNYLFWLWETRVETDYLFGCLVEQRRINTRRSLRSNFQKSFVKISQKIFCCNYSKSIVILFNVGAFKRTL